MFNVYEYILIFWYIEYYLYKVCKQFVEEFDSAITLISKL